jgi:molecular chaperone GrpE (heat shock protein)
MKSEKNKASIDKKNDELKTEAKKIKEKRIRMKQEIDQLQEQLKEKKFNI